MIWVVILKKINNKYNVQMWLVSVPLLLNKINRTYLMDFGDVNGFLKLLKKVPSMKNNHFGFMNEHN